jgi:hypothetical protein
MRRLALAAVATAAAFSMLTGGMPIAIVESSGGRSNKH